MREKGVTIQSRIPAKLAREFEAEAQKKGVSMYDLIRTKLIETKKIQKDMPWQITAELMVLSDRLKAIENFIESTLEENSTSIKRNSAFIVTMLDALVPGGYDKAINEFPELFE